MSTSECSAWVVARVLSSDNDNTKATNELRRLLSAAGVDQVASEQLMKNIDLKVNETKYI